MKKLLSRDPDSIGGFQLLGRLGAGGLGVVYIAHRDGVSVALKVMREALVDDPSERGRFSREIELLSKVDSLNVARIIDSGVDGEIAWFATEFVNGPNLKEHLAAHGTLAEDKWFSLAEGIFRGLADIHEQGIVHRDIKPANIILENGIPKIIDFGISQMAEATSLTATGVVAGSPAWFAPEQIDGKEATPATDLFAAGSVLAYAATGRTPWGDPETMTRASALRIGEGAPDLTGLSSEQRLIVERLIRSEPEDRRFHLDVLGEEPASNRTSPTILDGSASPSPGPDAATQRIRSKRERLVYLIPTAVLVLVLSGGFFWNSIEPGEPVMDGFGPTVSNSPETGDEEVKDAQNTPKDLSALPDLSAVSLTVASKDFAEQRILGEMFVQAFREAGAEVTNLDGYGLTDAVRNAQVTGITDAVPEYNGVGWLIHLGNSNPSFDPDELTEDVRARDLEENGIVWIGRSPFNNTYGFTSSPEATEANGGAFSLQSMMEYVLRNPEALVCMESQYASRGDGVVLVERATGIEMPPAQTLILDSGLIYSETANNNCTFGEVFTTDGRIPALELTLVEDPGVHVLYNVSLTLREETYNQSPEAFEVITDAILRPLDNERMAELNSLWSVGGQSAQEIARGYLEEIGLLR